MLFSYAYVPHRMEKMQEFIDFIFFEVWCKAPVAGPFDLHLFDGNADLKEVLTAFHYSDSKGANFFNGHVHGIYELFAELQPVHIQELKGWYFGNNNLERICANDPAISLVRYADLKAQYAMLRDEMAAFFKGLYDHSLLNLKALRDVIGKIDDHYTEFAKENRLCKCPFCGLNDLLGEYHRKREAYDHYLPKSIYPFNAINFRNLVPACHHCNSSYKGSKDSAFTPKDPCGTRTRRKLFYPYSTQPYRIDLKVELQHADHENLTPHDIILTFGPPELSEEIEAWKDIYEIEERYRAKLCGADAKAWAVEVLDEWRWYQENGGAEGRRPHDFLQAVARHTERSPYNNTNFLKSIYLDACMAVGIFNQAAEKTLAGDQA